MAKLIKFKSVCYYCGTVKNPFDAYLHLDRETREWKCHCFDCINNNVKSMTPSQKQEYLKFKEIKK